MAQHVALRSSEIDRYIDNDGFILSESDGEIGSNHVEEEWRIDGDEEFSDGESDNALSDIDFEEMDSSLVKNVLVNNPEGRRPPGRPKLRWRDQIRRDVRKLGRREEEAMDREIWRQCVGEAKYHLGYQEPRQ
ncbi:hypothetical protein J6590_060830 [Homalodisca vitripennis]|nr:hypothetical protein J6590_060830 [Homalodisca vitripennis]